jgi:hypothetical protein
MDCLLLVMKYSFQGKVRIGGGFCNNDLRLSIIPSFTDLLSIVYPTQPSSSVSF